MYDVNRKTYIIEKTCGHIIKIAVNQNMDIRVSSLSRNKLWFEPARLNLGYVESSWTNESLVFRDVRPRFGACIDNRDTIHIVCQNNIKGMNYIQLNNDMEIHSTPVNCESSTLPHDRYPEVFIAGDKIVLLYIDGYPGHTHIVLQTLDHNGSISSPKLLDNISYEKLPYSLTIDALKCPYLFYKKRIGSSYVLGYIKYMANIDSWTDFCILCSCAPESDILSAAVDCSGNIYLLWQTMAGQMTDLNCTVIHAAGKNPRTAKITGNSSYLFSNSSIITIGNHVIVYWVKNNCISYRISTDNGHFWKSQMSYDFHDSSPLHCISYLSNIRDKYGDNCVNPLPGKITKGLRLAFLNDFSASSENMAIEEIRSIICQLIKLQSYHQELLKQQSTNLDTLKQFVNHVDRKLDRVTEELNSFKEIYLNETEKKKTRTRKTPAADPVERGTGSALMQGTGFANVTEEYLKSLRKK
jgi:hypothetical protein